MKSMLLRMVVVGLTLLAGKVNAQDRIPWVADFGAACGMAAEQRRLVLVHFYNDNCGPCVRLEQNVFSKPEVADAIAQNYLAVKVHAGKNPQLATKYHVNQWPTDVFVTASGLEVFRTVSPQKPADYIAVLNQVAAQAGVAGSRLANNPLHTIAQAGSKTQAAVGGAAAGMASTFAAADQRVQQATADVHKAAAEAQQKWNAMTLPAQNAGTPAPVAPTSIYQQAETAAVHAEQQVVATAQQTAGSASTAVQQTEQRAAAAAQQAATTANHWESQVASTVQQYEQQATAAYQQARDRATQTSQQIGQQAETTKQQLQTTASQTAQEVNGAAQNLKQQASALGTSLLDRRSAFVPVEQSPAAPATSPAAPAGAPATSAVSGTAANAPGLAANASAVAASMPAAGPTAAATEKSAVISTVTPAVTSNPFVGPKPSESAIATITPPAQPQSHAQNLTQGSSNATATAATSAATVQASALLPAQQAPPTASASAPVGHHQMVPVSQAPPTGLDGFCPVTLVETMSNNPADRNAWKKGDRRFGAIHKGRTYLFTSAEQQQKFLQNPDAYAPVLSGCDPVAYAERGQMVDGKRAFGLVTADRRIYLFADEASRNRFEKSPGSYVGALQQATAQNSQSASIYR